MSHQAVSMATEYKAKVFMILPLHDFARIRIRDNLKLKSDCDDDGTDCHRFASLTGAKCSDEQNHEEAES